MAHRLKMNLDSGNRVLICSLIVWCCLFSQAPDAAGKPRGQLNINTATRVELESLPYIGPERAWALVGCRALLDRNIPAVDELLTCDNIGPDTLNAISPYLKVSGASDYLRPSVREAAADHWAEVFSPETIHTIEGDLVALTDKDYFPILLEKIENAQTAIDIAMFVFRTSTSTKNRPSLLVKKLIAARKRGVDIRVVLERSGHDDKLNEANEKTARRLRKNGIKVTFDSPRITTHTKAVVIDRRFSIVGSHNFTHSALKNNHEVSLLVDNRLLAEKLINYMDEIERGQ